MAVEVPGFLMLVKNNLVVEFFIAIVAKRL
jgi:hypothetical protein